MVRTLKHWCSGIVNILQSSRCTRTIGLSLHNWSDWRKRSDQMKYCVTIRYQTIVLEIELSLKTFNSIQIFITLKILYCSAVNTRYYTIVTETGHCNLPSGDYGWLLTASLCLYYATQIYVFFLHFEEHLT